MSNGSSGVIAGVAVVALSAGCMGGFTVYTDMQLMKLEMKNVQTTLDERKVSEDRFNALMNRMDKTLAVNTEAINSLQKAVNRLENGGYIAINYNNPEIPNDSRERNLPE